MQPVPIPTHRRPPPVPHPRGPLTDDFRATADTLPAGARTLEARYYVSDEVFAAERERILLRRWVCIGRDTELPNAGDFVTAEVGGESLLVLRGRDGAVRAFFNLCRHRGTRLCGAAQGSLPGRITCPYHAWTYGLAGELLSAPLMDEVAGFSPADYYLIRVPLERHGGLMFVNLAPDPEPFDTAVSAHLRRIDRWRLETLRTAHRIDYTVEANWKLVIENYSECYHCPLVHPLFTRHVHHRSGRNDSFDGALLGGYMELTDGTESLTPDGKRCGPLLGDLGPSDLGRVYFYALFPNLTISLHPDYVMMFLVQPLGPRQTLVRCEWLFPESALTEGKCRPQEAVAFWDRTNREDWTVCALVQQGVASRGYRPALMSTAESLPEAFNRQILAALR